MAEFRGLPGFARPALDSLTRTRSANAAIFLQPFYSTAERLCAAQSLRLFSASDWSLHGEVLLSPVISTHVPAAMAICLTVGGETAWQNGQASSSSYQPYRVQQLSRCRTASPDTSVHFLEWALSKVTPFSGRRS